MEKGLAVITLCRSKVELGVVCDVQVPIQIPLRTTYLVEHTECNRLFEVVDAGCCEL